MRPIALILLSLLLAGWLACEWEASGVTNSPASRRPEWRRTVRGWETRDMWTMPQRPATPPLHPALLAAAEVLAAVLILLASPAPAGAKSPAGGPAADFSADSCTE